MREEWVERLGEGGRGVVVLSGGWGTCGVLLRTRINSLTMSMRDWYLRMVDVMVSMAYAMLPKMVA